MSSPLEKILANPDDYLQDVPRLGECKIPSPVRRHEFVDEGERILLTENCSLIKFLKEKLGREPSFERAAPHAKIYHDPSWTRFCSSYDYCLKTMQRYKIILKYCFSILEIFAKI